MRPNLPSSTNRHRPFPLLFGLLLCSYAAIACTPASTSRTRHARPPVPVEGIARDSDTGEPIGNAWIFEATFGKPLTTDARRITAVRIKQSDATGRFAFKPTKALSTAIKEGNPPHYHFYHPSYGLVRGRAAEGEPVEFTVSLRNSHLRQQDAAKYCLPGALDPAENRNEMTHQLSKITCPPATPHLYKNGHPRAEGQTDEQGRRDGAWTFYRENETTIAHGTYAEGSAVDPWTFYAPGNEPPQRTGAPSHSRSLIDPTN